MRTGLIAALVALVHISVLSYAAGQGLFDEPALDVVIYGNSQGLDRAYQFPEYHALDILTQRNDNNRSGSSHWPGINQNSVKQFRKLGELVVDPEAVVTAQPLYVHSAVVRGVRQPVVIVATSNNVVFAFAPSVGSDAAQNPLWRTPPLGDPLRTNGDKQLEGAGCDIGPEAALSSTAPIPVSFVGIEATPVIDLANNQVLVGFKNANGDQHVAAVDLNNGRKKNDVIVRPPHGANNLEWRKLHRNRASLLLADGVVYLAFSSLCEGNKQIMHGSIVAFDARTLDQVGEFQVTDDRTDGGGIWQGATGPAADTDGNLYFVTGNRRLPGPCLVGVDDRSDPDATNLSNSVVRLKVEKRTASGSAPLRGETYSLRTTVYGYFTPYRKMLGDCWDLDLAASGPLLLPGTRFLVAGGKEGLIYVLDRAEMGGFDNVGAPWNFAGTSTMLINRKHRDVADDPKHDRLRQKFLAGENTYDDTYDVKDLMSWPHIHGTPVFARFGTDQAFMFVWPEKDTMKRYQWNRDHFDPVPARGVEHAPPHVLPRYPGDKRGDKLNGMPGGMLSVNIDPSGPSLGVVLASVKICDALGHAEQGFSNPGYPSCEESQDRGILRAYDPFTMKQVWSNEGDDYWFAKFVPPTIAADRIFLPTASGKVLVYGP